MQFRSCAFAEGDRYRAGSRAMARTCCRLLSGLARRPKPEASLICDAPYATAGTWHHWAAYDLPAAQTGLDAGAAQRPEGLGFKQAINDFKRPGYGGPCPPRGHGPHHYRFRLLALSIEHLAVQDKPHFREVEREASKHVLAEVMLVGTYGR